VTSSKERQAQPHHTSSSCLPPTTALKHMPTSSQSASMALRAPLKAACPTAAVATLATTFLTANSTTSLPPQCWARVRSLSLQYALSASRRGTRLGGPQRRHGELTHLCRLPPPLPQWRCKCNPQVKAPGTNHTAKCTTSHIIHQTTSHTANHGLLAIRTLSIK